MKADFMAPMPAKALLGKQARDLASRVPNSQMSKKDHFVAVPELGTTEGRNLCKYVDNEGEI